MTKPPNPNPIGPNQNQKYTIVYSIFWLIDESQQVIKKLQDSWNEHRINFQKNDRTQILLNIFELKSENFYFSTTFKHKQEKKCLMRCALFTWCWVFPMGNEERGGAAQGTILLLFLFTPHELVVQKISIMHCGPGLVSRA